MKKIFSLLGRGAVSIAKGGLKPLPGSTLIKSFKEAKKTKKWLEFYTYCVGILAILILLILGIIQVKDLVVVLPLFGL